MPDVRRCKSKLRVSQKEKVKDRSLKGEVEIEVQSGDGKTVKKRRAESRHTLPAPKPKATIERSEDAASFCRDEKCADGRGSAISLEQAQAHLLATFAHLLHEASFAVGA